MKKQLIYYSITILLFISIISFASASTGSYNWNFSTASDYAYTPSEIIVSGGSAYLNGTSTSTYSWWHLNENTGTNVVDSSGNNYNGTAILPLWVTGKLNSALQFNGVNQSINYSVLLQTLKEQKHTLMNSGLKLLQLLHHMQLFWENMRQ